MAIGQLIGAGTGHLPPPRIHAPQLTLAVGQTGTDVLSGYFRGEEAGVWGANVGSSDVNC